MGILISQLMFFLIFMPQIQPTLLKLKTIRSWITFQLIELTNNLTLISTPNMCKSSPLQFQILVIWFLHITRQYHYHILLLSMHLWCPCLQSINRWISPQILSLRQGSILKQILHLPFIQMHPRFNLNRSQIFEPTPFNLRALAHSPLHVPPAPSAWPSCAASLGNFIALVSSRLPIVHSSTFVTTQILWSYATIVNTRPICTQVEKSQRKSFAIVLNAPKESSDHSLVSKESYIHHGELDIFFKESDE